MRLTTLFKHWSYRIFAPGTMLRERYESLKKLLAHDIACHEQMAEIQEVLHGNRLEDLAALRKRIDRFSREVAAMVAALEKISPGSYAELKSYHQKFSFYTQFLLAAPAIRYSPPFTLALDECAELSSANSRIGSKAKNLASVSRLSGVLIPDGYVVTADACHYFIEYNDLRGEIDRVLESIDITSTRSLKKSSDRLMALMMQAQIPPVLGKEILAAYDRCFQKTPQPLAAVRSNAVKEDGEVSFAGQYLSLLNQGRDDLCRAYVRILASKYSPEALYYRISHGLGDEETAMSVLIQEMIPARCSGVIYTINPDGSDDPTLHIHIIPGAPEQLVSGRAIAQTCTLARTRPSTLLSSPYGTPLLDERQSLALAELGLAVEEHFGCAQDMEWAINLEGRIILLQTRRLRIPTSKTEESPPKKQGPVLFAGGVTASPGMASGQIVQAGQNARDVSELDLPEQTVLVTRNTPPELARIRHKLAAVVAEQGSRASHFATIAREFGVPLITEAGKACRRLKDGSLVTVDSRACRIYKGLQPSKQTKSRRKDCPRAMREAGRFITALELIDPSAENFTPEGCRSMHDIIRFCHEKAMQAMFATARPATGRGALRLKASIPLDVFLFNVGDGVTSIREGQQTIELKEITSIPFQALWKGLSHPDVQWKQKPFDWAAFDRIEMSGAVPPKRDSFAFASYAVIGYDYLHFNIRFGYHFTIVDILCGENSAENYCMLRFAGGGGDYDQRLLRISFISGVLKRLGFSAEQKGDLLEAKLTDLELPFMQEKLDILGRLLGATKLMDMVLDDEAMAEAFVDDFFQGRYSFSQEG
jgi:pyruvate,water dikinase